MDNSSLQLEDPDPVNGFYGNPWLIAFLLIPFGITQTVGNGLLYGIIFYEKYGVDPQKRTLINMLVGQLCWSIIFLNIADYPIPTFRYFFGPYPLWMLDVLFLVSYSVIIIIMLILSQLAVCKFLQVFAFSHYSTIDEYFMAQMCFNLNTLLSVLISMVTVITDTPNCHDEIIFWVGFQPPCDQNLFQNVVLGCLIVPATITLLTYILLYPAIMIKKRKLRRVFDNPENSVHQVGGLNNASRNETLLAGPMPLFLLLVFCIVSSPFVFEFLGLLEHSIYSRVFNLSLFHLMSSVIMPAAFFVRKPEAWRVLKDFIVS